MGFPWLVAGDHADIDRTGSDLEREAAGVLPAAVSPASPAAPAVVPGKPSAGWVWISLSESEAAGLAFTGGCAGGVAAALRVAEGDAAGAEVGSGAAAIPCPADFASVADVGGAAVADWPVWFGLGCSGLGWLGLGDSSVMIVDSDPKRW